MTGNTATLKGKRVLVTGGTGFIGGRLVEKLVLEYGAGVRVLTSNYAGASRVSRFDVELMHGAITDPDTVRRAMEGCAVVFHLAFGGRGGPVERRAVTVDGTRNVLEAALHERVERVVHVSTMVVYGLGIEGDLDETAPRRKSGVEYADTKSEAEEIALRYASEHALPVTVIQPTTVYGPFAPSWTVRVLESLKTGRVVLVDGGSGLSNAVYVDDVVQAIVLAARREEAVGEAFLVSGDEQVTWRRFYERYQAMLGVDALVTMSAAEANAHYQQRRRRPGLIGETASIVREERELRRRLLRTREISALYGAAGVLASIPAMQRLRKRLKSTSGKGKAWSRLAPKEPTIHAVDPRQVAFLAAKTNVRIDKAKRILGYEPAFDFDRGMDLTERWAAWANLLDAHTAS